MIRKYLLYAFAFTSLIFTSCMDSFLDRNPYGAIDETTFYRGLRLKSTTKH